jgi:hypothetical protein
MQGEVEEVSVGCAAGRSPGLAAAACNGAGGAARPGMVGTSELALRCLFYRLGAHRATLRRARGGRKCRPRVEAGRRSGSTGRARRGERGARHASGVGSQAPRAGCGLRAHGLGKMRGLGMRGLGTRAWARTSRRRVVRGCARAGATSRSSVTRCGAGEFDQDLLPKFELKCTEQCIPKL